MDKKVSEAYSIKNQNRIIDIPEGLTILREGEINLDMYQIVQGHVEMYTGHGTSEEVLIGILGPGACFGEFGLLLQKPAIYTIIAFSDVKLLRVTGGYLDDFVKEYPDSVIHIMKNMANMMMTMQHNINQLSNELEIMKDPTNSTVRSFLNEVRAAVDQTPQSDDDSIVLTSTKDILRQNYVQGYHFIGKDRN